MRRSRAAGWAPSCCERVVVGGEADSPQVVEVVDESGKCRVPSFEALEVDRGRLRWYVVVMRELRLRLT